MRTIDEYVNEVTMNRVTVLEEHVRVLVQDKPRWLPERVWDRLLQRVPVVQAKTR